MAKDPKLDPPPSPAAPAAPVPASPNVLTPAAFHALPPMVQQTILQAQRQAAQDIEIAANLAVARVLDGTDGMTARPPNGIALHQLGEVLIGNWIGSDFDGKPWRVMHGTPIRGLPDTVVERIRRTPGQETGVIPAPPVKAA